MPEIHNKTYAPISGAHRVFVRNFFPVGDLTLNVNAYSEPANFTSWSRQAFKIRIESSAAPTPTSEFTVQEPIAGVWVDKGSLTPAVAVVGVVCEHHSEDVLQEARIRFKPLVAKPTEGIFVEISGKQWL